MTNLKDEKTVNNSVIENSKKVLSDSELLANLKNLNVDNLTEKTVKSNELWKNDAKIKFSTRSIDSYKDSPKEHLKSGRKSLRKKQLELSAILFKNKQIGDKNLILQSAKNLHNFYNECLISFSNYSNISKKENERDFIIIHSAYAIMQSEIKK